MKKIIFTFMLCIVSTLCFCQEKIGNYHSNYFDNDFYVECCENPCEYDIQIFGETTTKHYCFINKYIDNFRVSLPYAKDKQIFRVGKGCYGKRCTKYVYQILNGTFACYDSECHFNFYTFTKPLITSTYTFPKSLITPTGDSSFCFFLENSFLRHKTNI